MLSWLKLSVAMCAIMATVVASPVSARILSPAEQILQEAAERRSFKEQHMAQVETSASAVMAGFKDQAEFNEFRTAFRQKFGMEFDPAHPPAQPPAGFDMSNPDNFLEISHSLSSPPPPSYGGPSPSASGFGPSGSMPPPQGPNSMAPQQGFNPSGPSDQQGFSGAAPSGPSDFNAPPPGSMMAPPSGFNSGRSTLDSVSSARGSRIVDFKFKGKNLKVRVPGARRNGRKHSRKGRKGSRRSRRTRRHADGRKMNSADLAAERTRLIKKAKAKAKAMNKKMLPKSLHYTSTYKKQWLRMPKDRSVKKQVMVKVKLPVEPIPENLLGQSIPQVEEKKFQIPDPNNPGRTMTQSVRVTRYFKKLRQAVVDPMEPGKVQLIDVLVEVAAPKRTPGYAVKKANNILGKHIDKLQRQIRYLEHKVRNARSLKQASPILEDGAPARPDKQQQEMAHNLYKLLEATELHKAGEIRERYLDAARTVVLAAGASHEGFADFEDKMKDEPLVPENYYHD